MLYVHLHYTTGIMHNHIYTAVYTLIPRPVTMSCDKSNAADMILSWESVLVIWVAQCHHRTKEGQSQGDETAAEVRVTWPQAKGEGWLLETGKGKGNSLPRSLQKESC